MASKIRNGFTKYILPETKSDILPQLITWRKDKVGYETPQKQWMANPILRDYIHEARKKLVAKKILNPSVMSKQIERRDAFDAGNLLGHS